MNSCRQIRHVFVPMGIKLCFRGKPLSIFSDKISWMTCKEWGMLKRIQWNLTNKQTHKQTKTHKKQPNKRKKNKLGILSSWCFISTSWPAVIVFLVDRVTFQAASPNSGMGWKRADWQFINAYLCLFDICSGHWLQSNVAPLAQEV